MGGRGVWVGELLQKMGFSSAWVRYTGTVTMGEGSVHSADRIQPSDAFVTKVSCHIGRGRAVA